MKVETKKLKLFLLDSGLITSKDITEAEKKPKKREKIWETLWSAAEDFRRRLKEAGSLYFRHPFRGAGKRKIDFAVLSLIPEPIARNHNIVAYRKNKDELEVAMLDPEDLGTIDFIKKKASLKILPRLTNSKSIKSALSPVSGKPAVRV